LVRVSARLREELGALAVPVRWEARRGVWLVAGGRKPAPFSPDDWLLTAELFCEVERPGFWHFLREAPCRLAALFHDVIPLRHPQITWPQSVARHPEYMKMLAAFDRVWAVSEASRRDLVEFWRWQGGPVRATTGTIMLGADFDRQARSAPPADPPAAQLLSVGILEPRAHYYEAATDRLLESLYTVARLTAFPTLAEGCGLPVLESLWKGRPCVCSDLPVLREIADAGGCVVAAPNDLGAWVGALRTVLTDDVAWRRLAAEAGSRPLPAWADTARALLAGMG
jgi:glycosyltransferase involved in cell wall biosynthesis